jgi:hypothetical protein
LRSGAATAIVAPMAARHRMEGPMGDKSPKSKQRDQKQKDAARAEGAAQAKAKQQSYSQGPPIPGKGKK